MSEHTKLPWTAEAGGYVLDKDGMTILRPVGNGDNKAVAEYLVEASNNHESLTAHRDALLAACEKTITTLTCCKNVERKASEYSRGYSDGLTVATKQIAAIAAAGGGE